MRIGAVLARVPLFTEQYGGGCVPALHGGRYRAHFVGVEEVASDEQRRSPSDERQIAVHLRGELVGIRTAREAIDAEIVDVNFANQGAKLRDGLARDVSESLEGRCRRPSFAGESRTARAAAPGYQPRFVPIGTRPPRRKFLVEHVNERAVRQRALEFGRLAEAQCDAECQAALEAARRGRYRIWRGVELDAAELPGRLVHRQRQCDDTSARVVFAPLVAHDHAVRLHHDAFYPRTEAENRARVDELGAQKVDERAVALAAARLRLRRCCLSHDGPRAHAVRRRRMEAFDEMRQPACLLATEMALFREIERRTRVARTWVPDRVQHFAEHLGRAHLAGVELVMLAFDALELEAGLLDEVVQLRRPTMYEFRAELDGAHRPIRPLSQDTPAGLRAPFEHRHTRPGTCEAARGVEPGNARTHDDEVGFGSVHRAPIVSDIAVTHVACVSNPRTKCSDA